jgi:hypothetical protein
MVLIFKHAAHLSLSGTPAYAALTQAEAAFQSANMMSKIQEKFPPADQDYTMQQILTFLLNTDISLSIFASI